MPPKFESITFTRFVKETQAKYSLHPPHAPDADEKLEDDLIGKAEADFIEERDSFYIASVNADGWPYMQFRGGPPGFVKVIDASTMAYGDFSGNRHYVTMGNLTTNDRVCLFFMDYPRRRRLKVLAHATVVETDDDPKLAEAVALEGYKGRVERLVRFHIIGLQWSCPQHITKRFSEAEIRDMTP